MTSNDLPEGAIRGSSQDPVTPKAQGHEAANLSVAAAAFAREFNISYDKIKVSPKGQFVSFKHDTDISGGWHEGTPAISIHAFIIRHWYAKYAGNGLIPTDSEATDD